MKRLPDHRQRMNAAINEARGREFEYGTFDCCLAAATVIEAMTGTDLMADFRGRYKSAAGAARLLKETGYPTLLKMLISHIPEHGGKRIPVAKAGIGDLVLTKVALHDAAMGQACGICCGRFALFPGQTGWTSLSMKHVHAAWRVG